VIRGGGTIRTRQKRRWCEKELLAVLVVIGGAARNLRDRALLLIGFVSGFMRSTRFASNCKNVERVWRGLVITLLRSKTDQEGVGRKTGIPLGRTAHCPVTAVERWIDVARVMSGPLFRPIDRHGRTSAPRLFGEAVSLIVQERVAAAGLNPGGYSGRTLRAGFATSVAMAGVSSTKIKRQTGHVSDGMLMRYIRDGDLILEGAAGALL
jgi:hypothetical protein